MNQTHRGDDMGADSYGSDSSYAMITIVSGLFPERIPGNIEPPFAILFALLSKCFLIRFPTRTPSGMPTPDLSYQ
jgi:hypothetical protein